MGFGRFGPIEIWRSYKKEQHFKSMTLTCNRLKEAGDRDVLPPFTRSCRTSIALARIPIADELKPGL